MPAHEFLLVLDLPEQVRRDEAFVDAVARKLFALVGYPYDATTELVALLDAALVQDSPPESHAQRVRFTVQGGELQIIVSYGDGREWRTRRSLP